MGLPTTYTWLHSPNVASSMEAIIFFGLIYVSNQRLLETFTDLQQVLGVIAYRITLHPLAKYPGPLLGRITDWYSVIRSAVGDRHIHFLELHHKYADGLQKIYGTKANTQKASYYHVFNDVFQGDSSLTTIDPSLHTKKKRVISTALSENSIRDMEGLVLRYIRIFTQMIGEVDNIKTSIEQKTYWSSSRNMTDWCGYLSFDIMGDICFSGGFAMLQNEENRFILKVLPEGVNALNIVSCQGIPLLRFRSDTKKSSWMPGILRMKLGSILFAKLIKDMRRYEAFSNRQSQKRLALGNESGHKDVYSHLLASNEVSRNGKPLFTVTDLVGESSLLITGGSDTTATAMSSTIFYILHNPAALVRLEAEVIPRFNDVEEIRGGSTLASCRWLRACIDEAMRMSPGVPGLLPREVLEGGLVVEKTFFPAGTDMGVSHYAIHHNEEYYPDSFAYKPERWRAQSALCPFSIGPRGCVGKAMAMKELMLVIARIVWLYEMRLAPGEHRGGGGRDAKLGRHRISEFQMRDMFVSKTDGPVVQYRFRPHGN
ncbi:MAG: hypothetical protein Q9195_004779 [Heterodermia aff. obscurata]